MKVPPTKALGRFFFESFSSAFIEVAITQPSYAKDVATTAVNRAVPPGTSFTTVVKFYAVIPVFRT